MRGSCVLIAATRLPGTSSGPKPESTLTTVTSDHYVGCSVSSKAVRAEDNHRVMHQNLTCQLDILACAILSRPLLRVGDAENMCPNLYRILPKASYGR